MKARKRSLWLLSLLMVTLTAAAVAQDNKREAQLRTVRGVVTDKSDTSIPASVVFSRKDIVINLKIDKKKSLRIDTTVPLAPGIQSWVVFPVSQ